MKKLLLFYSVLLMSLISCSDDDEIATRTFVEITVTENLETKSGVTVYMFSDLKGPDTGFFDPFYADKSVITENDGVATFNLQEVFDLDIIDTQTTLYFAVFESDIVLGQTALTIEKGETKASSVNF